MTKQKKYSCTDLDERNFNKAMDSFDKLRPAIERSLGKPWYISLEKSDRLESINNTVQLNSGIPVPKSLSRTQKNVYLGNMKKTDFNKARRLFIKEIGCKKEK